MKVRISFLTIILGSVFFFLGKTILLPVNSKIKISPLAFPTVVPLSEWQFINSYPLTAPVVSSSTYLSGRHYKYVKENLTLDIEMRYMVNTDGDVKSFIQNYSSIPLPPGQLSLILHQQEGIGFYSLFTNQRRAYLSTCINSRGGSTVTDLQFRRNRDVYDNIYSMWDKERLLPWLLGRGSVRDMRCLWVELSTPVKKSSLNNTYSTLEKAWFSWYQWWHSRFPQP